MRIILVSKFLVSILLLLSSCNRKEAEEPQNTKKYPDVRESQNLSKEAGLPLFDYHPDPLKTGAIIKADTTCECCDRSRGYVYNLGIYAKADVDSICPWCIESGKASRKFKGVFVDVNSLAQQNISEDIMSQISDRTPGYLSRQQAIWLSCCEDACEYHGDATREELLKLSNSEVELMATNTDIPVNILHQMISAYEAEGSIGFYKFICRSCNKVKYHVDTY